METPSITQQIYELKKAGWKELRPTVWMAPNGVLYRDPYDAWRRNTQSLLKLLEAKDQELVAMQSELEKTTEDRNLWHAIYLDEKVMREKAQSELKTLRTSKEE